MSTNSKKCILHLSECILIIVLFFHLGGIKTPAGHEKEETRDVKDTDGVPEGKTGLNIPRHPFIPASSLLNSPRPILSFTPSSISLLVLPPPGLDKPPGQEPRDETRGASQHHEDPEGADGEDRTAAE